MLNLPVPIIRAKLYPPPLAADVLHRERLAALAPALTGAAATLISAPAGYGKSTLASHWVNDLAGSAIWLSLDPSDSELRQFLSYLVAALDSEFPGSFVDIADVLSSATLPETELLLGAFCNAIDALGRPLAIVLDDYHQITASEVHEFLDALLQRPPRHLQVVIITRRDPPLSLQVLRARGTLTEVRMQQLAFLDSETVDFVTGKLGADIADAVIAHLHQRTEGWPAGLRLAMLAAADTSRRDEVLESIPANPLSVREYLMHEVLGKSPAPMREYLLRTAYLGRISAPLCEAVYRYGNARRSDVSGTEFIRWLEESGLFCIALDAERQWYRYHHLFQSMLKEEALASLGEEGVRGTQIAAAAWCEDQLLLEDAIGQLLGIEEFEKVAELIIRHRNPITNNEQWHRLNSWLRQLPSATVESRPELLLLQARWLRTAGSREESQHTLDRVAALVESSAIDDALKNELYGSLASSRSFLKYTQADGEGALAQAKLALELLPEDSAADRGFTMIIYAGAMQMMGDVSGAQKMLTSSLAEALASSDIHPTFIIRTFLSRAFVDWMNADLPSLSRSADQAGALGESAQLLEVHAVARSMQAAVHYHRNELRAIAPQLAPVLRSGAIVNAEFQAQCLIISSLTEQSLGNTEAASHAAAALHDMAMKTQNIYLTHMSEAFAAELAMRQGRMVEAMRWAQSCDPEPLTPMYAFYSPPMTLAKVLVLEDSAASRDLAAPFLDRLVDYLARIHNKRFLAEALALRALLRSAAGDPGAALEDLARGLSMAQPGRFIRLFVDLGPRLGKLLSRLELDEEGLSYVGEILAAFNAPASAPGPATVAPPAAIRDIGVEALSRREQEILSLLSERLSNKEIADRLHISPVTVKRHAANIFQKLGVHGRREAVAKATGLGIIGRSP